MTLLTCLMVSCSSVMARWSSVLLLGQALTSSSRITFWPLIVRQNVRKIEALHLLDPQFALLLLSGCLALVLGYHLQVTPPRLALAAAQAWDAAVDAARLRIASDPALGRAPLVSAALLDLSARKARLPLKSGGLGHTSAVLLSLLRCVLPARFP